MASIKIAVPTSLSKVETLWTPVTFEEQPGGFEFSVVAQGSRDVGFWGEILLAVGHKIFSAAYATTSLRSQALKILTVAFSRCGHLLASKMTVFGEYRTLEMEDN